MLRFDRLATVAAAPLVAAVVASLASRPAAAQERMTRLSERHAWYEGNGSSPYRSDLCAMVISADERWIVYDSASSTFDHSDQNGVVDVYMTDRTTGLIRRLSLGDGASFDPDMSADGRFVCFESSSTNLVANDTNGVDDIFLLDRDSDANGILDDTAWVVTRVSVDSSGGQANGGSSSPTISADGTRICFMSGASNLVSGDTNSSWDAFIHDVATGSTERVDLIDGGGKEAKYGCLLAGMSGDGTTVAFDSYSDDFVSKDTNGKIDVFVRQIKKQSTERVSVSVGGNKQGDDDSLMVKKCLSFDGSRVVFESWATNLYANDTNYHRDVFMRDRFAAATTLLSVDDKGNPGDFDNFGATICDKGNRVAFSALSSNLVANDGNGTYDVFLHDDGLQTTELISVTPGGTSGMYRSDGATISSGGNLVAFQSQAMDLVDGKTNAIPDLFVRDTNLDSTTRASAEAPGEAHGESFSHASVSTDGRYAVFQSDAPDLVLFDTNGCTDVFVLDRLTNLFTRMSVATDGSEGNGPSYDPVISGNGRFVAFATLASNLFAGDGYWWGGYFYNHYDVVVHDRDPDGNGWFDEPGATTTLVSLDSSGYHPRYYDSGEASISDDGDRVAFSSWAPLDWHGYYYCLDVYVRDQSAATTRMLSLDPSGTSGANANAGRPSISSDGSFVAFQSFATNLASNDATADCDIFLRNVASGSTALVSVDTFGGSHFGNCFMTAHAISSDGTQIVFDSVDPLLDPYDANGHRDIFVHDMNYGTTLDLSIITGTQSNGDSFDASISPYGRYVAFTSLADNYAPLDSNGLADVFLHDRYNVTTQIVSANCAGVSGDGDSTYSTVTGQGTVVFSSHADDLVRGDTNHAGDIFVFDPSAPFDDAWWANYGSGFPGTYGVPILVLSADPVLGDYITMTLGNSLGAQTIALLFASPSSASLSTGYGATFLVDLASSIRFTLPLPAGGLALSDSIPLDPAFCGVSVYFQALELDNNAIKHISFTAGLECHFGH